MDIRTRRDAADPDGNWKMVENSQKVDYRSLLSKSAVFVSDLGEWGGGRGSLGTRAAVEDRLPAVKHQLL